MKFKPPRLRGSLFGAGFLIVLGLATAFSLGQLDVSPVTPWILVWVLLPLTCLPLAGLVIYRLYGLWTAGYSLDREGFYMRWGLGYEQIPLAQVEAVEPAAQWAEGLQLTPGWWWPGCAVTQAWLGQGTTAEVYAGGDPLGGLVVRTQRGAFLITPANSQDFVNSFTNATRQGSLRPISADSRRPDFLVGKVWADRWARRLIVSGAVIPLLLLAFVGWQASSLSGLVPFGFDQFGSPDPLAPPGRLLLLPLMAGVLWLVDATLGVWLHQDRGSRDLAYTVWLMAVVSGLLLWGAAFQLISRA